MSTQDDEVRARILASNPALSLQRPAAGPTAPPVAAPPAGGSDTGPGPQSAARPPTPQLPGPVEPGPRVVPAGLRGSGQAPIDIIVEPRLQETEDSVFVSRKMTPEKQDQAIAVMEGGGTIALAAKALGVGRSTLERFIKHDAEFQARVNAARALVDDAVEAALFNLAIGKIKDPGKGQAIAIFFWLKNRRPQQWRDIAQLDVRTPGEGNEAQFILPGGAVLSPASSGLSVARTPKRSA